MTSCSKTRLTVTAISLLIAVLGGCYKESSKVVLHKPGEYQGAPDPFLKLTANPAHAKKLEARFLAIQTDR